MDVTLKVSKVIEKTEKYNLILEIVVLYLKSYFLFIIFLYSYLIIYIY